MTDQKSHKTSIAQADLTISAQPLDAETFLDMATRSGWRRMTQNALEDEKRKPFVLHPQPVTITWKSKDGEIIGVVSGTNYGAYAFMQAMMIPVEHQGQGYGTQLLHAAEQEARTCGCDQMVLSSFSVQAPGFYQTQGYEVFALLENHPRHHRHYYLRKRFV